MDREWPPSADGSPPRFEIRGSLGRGGEAEVFRAFDRRLRRDVALKRTDALPAADRDRVLRAAEVQRELDSRHIVRMLDCGVADSHVFMVMELIDGGTLLDWLHRQPQDIEPRRIQKLLSGVCDALSRAHARKVIHGDIKPSNVLMDGDLPKLGDFGLARILPAADPSLLLSAESTRHVRGTPAFMAPEVRITGKSSVASDIYSLGATLYVLATRFQPPVHLDSVPAPWRAIVSQATHPDPRRRYASVKDFRDALEEAVTRPADPPAAPAETCPGCGRPADGAAQHCGACGESLLRPCGACEAQIRRSVAHCTECGADVRLVDDLAPKWKALEAARRGKDLARMEALAAPFAGLPETARLGARESWREGARRMEKKVRETRAAIAGLAEEAARHQRKGEEEEELRVLARILSLDAGAAATFGRRFARLEKSAGASRRRRLASEARRLLKARDWKGAATAIELRRKSIEAPDRMQQKLDREEADLLRRIRKEAGAIEEHLKQGRLGRASARLSLVPGWMRGHEAIEAVRTAVAEQHGAAEAVARQKGRRGRVGAALGLFAALVATGAVKHQLNRPKTKVVKPPHYRTQQMPSAIKNRITNPKADAPSPIQRSSKQAAGDPAQVSDAAAAVPEELRGAWWRVRETAPENESGNALRVIEALGRLRPPAALGYSDGTLARLSRLLGSDGFDIGGWNGKGLVEVVHRLSGIAFILCPEGRFRMGSETRDAQPDEKPARNVAVDAFLLARTELTHDQLERLRGGKGSPLGNTVVKSLTFTDAASILRQARLELPTEARWEYACRAGSTSTYPWGDLFDGNQAWYRDNAPRYDGGKGPFGGYLAPRSGQRPPNAWGFHDMIGSVAEWCGDWYAPYTSGAASDPRGPGTGTKRVVRGGNVWATPEQLRSSTRFAEAPGIDVHPSARDQVFIGVRPAASLPAPW